MIVKRIHTMNLYRVFRNVSFGSLGLWGLDLDIYIVVGCFFFFVDKISYPTVERVCILQTNFNERVNHPSLIYIKPDL